MMNSFDRYKAGQKAIQKMLKAIKDGLIERPNTCELCGATPEPFKVHYKSGITSSRPAIQAHHWKGYDFPLEVWFICQTCNARLKGECFHNGSTSKEEAREYILNFQYAGPEPAWNHRCEYDGCNNFARSGRHYCYHHNPNDDRPTCNGTTLVGQKCKRKLDLKNGYCVFHWKQDPFWRERLKAEISHK